MNRLKAGVVLTAAAAAMVFAAGGKDAVKVANTEAPVTRAETVVGLEKEMAAATEAAATEGAASAENTASEVKSKLTGKVVDAEIGEKRPIAIMLNNIYDALPQAGISRADVVYEAPVEGGLTRLMGIFEDYQGMEKIGSVRSCRDYYIAFAKEYDAIYVHYGQAVYAFDKLNAEGTDNISGLQYQEQAGAISGYCGEDIFYRTSDRPAPHNVYISEEGIKTAIERNGYRTDYKEGYEGHFQFAGDGETIVPDGGSAYTIDPGYQANKPWFEYDEETGLYDRFQYGTMQTDQLSDEQLAYTNVIFQVCQWENYDENGYLKFDTQSGGDMYYFTKGAYQKGTWKKADPEDADSPAVYYDANGNVLTVNQGKTWVCIIQDSYADRIVIE